MNISTQKSIMTRRYSIYLLYLSACYGNDILWDLCHFVCSYLCPV